MELDVALLIAAQLEFYTVGNMCNCLMCPFYDSDMRACIEGMDYVNPKCPTHESILRWNAKGSPILTKMGNILKEII